MNASYTVAGMTCAHCAAAVTAEVSRLTRVRHVEIDLVTGRVRVDADRPLDVEQVRAAVDEAGYELVG
jgi:copper chaperone CopZ